MTERVSPSGIDLLQGAGLRRSPPRARRPTWRSWTCTRTSRTSRSRSTGRSRSRTNGVIIGLPTRELRGGDADQDHVPGRLASASARSTTRTCTSGGATTSPRTSTSGPSSRRATRTCRRATTRPARRPTPPAASARRRVTRRSRPASSNRFNTTYNSTSANNWNVAPSNPTNANLFGTPDVHAVRPLLHRAARDPRQGELRHAPARRSRPPTAAVRSRSRSRSRSTRSGCRTSPPACKNKLDVFFKQWWDTAYSGSPAAGNKPQITGPGLAGPGFYDANGGCAAYGVDMPGEAGGTVPATLALTLGAAATFGTFTPGVAQDVHGVHDGDRHLDRRRRDADRGRPERERPGHLVNGAFSLPQPLGGLGVLKTYAGAGQQRRRRRSRSRRRSARPTRCARGRTPRRSRSRCQHDDALGNRQAAPIPSAG